jgi:hypothetical protein
LKLRDKHYSEGVLKEVVWLSGVIDSFAEAEEVLQRVGHLSISDSSVWRRKEEWGKRFKAIEKARREKANTLSRGNNFREQVLGSTKRMGVSMDGTKVYIREEKWKELKVGCSFQIDVFPTWNRETQEWEELAHAVDNRYVAHLGGPELFGQMMWAEARQRGWEQAEGKEVIGDGAPWIWNLAQEYFYDAQHDAVDWYHAMEHLSDIAILLHEEGAPAAQQWYKSAQTTLYQGHAGRMALELNKTAADYPPKVADELQKEASYLEKHKRRMQYSKMREDGYVIGSGMVESGCKQFKARFRGSGMRWSREGIERLIPIRAAIMSGRFDTMWQTAYNSPPN